MQRNFLLLLLLASSVEGRRPIKGQRVSRRTQDGELIVEANGLPKNKEPKVAGGAAGAKTGPGAKTAPGAKEVKAAPGDKANSGLVKENSVGGPEEAKAKKDKGLVNPDSVDDDKKAKDKKQKCIKRSEVSGNSAVQLQVKEAKEPKAPKVGGPPLPGSPPNASPNDEVSESNVAADEEEELPICPDPQLKSKSRAGEECTNLEQGNLPNDRAVVGQLNFELEYDESATTAKEAMKNIENVLRTSTSPQAAGCATKQKLRRSLQDGSQGEEEASPLAISGVKFDDVKLESDDCPSAGKSEGCDSVSTTVDVYYEGDRDATEEEGEIMFSLVMQTIQAQSANGEFGDTQVGALEAVVDGNKIDGSGAPVGAIAGASAAAAAAVAGVVVYRKYGTEMMAKWS